MCALPICQIGPLAPGERWAPHIAPPPPAVRAIAACLSPDRQPSSNLSLGFVNLSLDRTDDTVRDPVRHLFHTVSLWRCSAGSSGAGGTGEEQGSRPREPSGRALSSHGAAHASSEEHTSALHSLLSPSYA